MTQDDKDYEAPVEEKVDEAERDLADLDTVRAELLERLPEPRPAATLVEVSGLVDPTFLVEIDAVADLGAVG